MSDDTALLRAARARQQAGDPAAACDGLPDSAEARALRALCAWMTAPGLAAQSCLDQARECKIVDRDHASDLGAACLLAGDLAAAERYLQQACAGPGVGAVAHSRMGALHLARRDLDRAADAFETAIRQRPEWSVAHGNLGATRLRQHRPADALVAYDRAMALAPDDADLSDRRAAALVALGRTQEVLAPLRARLAAGENGAALHRQLAARYLLADDDASAQVHLRAALDRDPADPATSADLARVLGRRHRHATAAQVLDAALEHWPEDARIHALRAVTAAELGQPDIARQHLDQAATLASDAPETHLARGQTAFLSGDMGAAIAAYEAASQRLPHAVEPLLGLGEVLMTAGRIDAAIAVFGRAVDLSPLGFVGLAEARALPANAPAMAQIEACITSPVTPRPVRTAMSFALARVLDTTRDTTSNTADNTARAFALAADANAAERAGLTYSAARTSALVDRLIETFHGQLFDQLRGIGSDTERPIFVCGMPRSGTTLVEQILGLHQDVHPAGELSAMPRIASGLHRRLVTAVPYPHCAALLDAQTVRAAAEDYLAALGGDTPRIVDKLPHNFLHLGLIAILMPRARIVHVTRDPRDVAVSSFFMDFRHKAGLMGYAFDMGDIAAMLADHARLMTHWRAVLPTPPIEVAYETLVSDFDGQTRRLFAALSLHAPPAAGAFASLDRPVRTGSVWQVRQPLYETSVARWRRHAAHLPPEILSLGDQNSDLD